MQRILLSLLLFVVAVTAGCISTISRIQELEYRQSGRRAQTMYFDGVKATEWQITQACNNPDLGEVVINGVICAVDLPFSFVGDVLLIPLDAIDDLWIRRGKTAMNESGAAATRPSPTP